MHKGDGPGVISLRRHIDEYGKSVTDSWRSAYSSALVSIARTAGRAFPALGNNLRQGLDGIGARIDAASTESEITSIANDLEGALALWGEGAAAHFQENLEHLREIITAVTDPLRQLRIGISSIRNASPHLQRVCIPSPASTI